MACAGKKIKRAQKKLSERRGGRYPAMVWRWVMSVHDLPISPPTLLQPKRVLDRKLTKSTSRLADLDDGSGGEKQRLIRSGDETAKILFVCPYAGQGTGGDFTAGSQVAPGTGRFAWTWRSRIASRPTGLCPWRGRERARSRTKKVVGVAGTHSETKWGPRRFTRRRAEPEVLDFRPAPAGTCSRLRRGRGRARGHATAGASRLLVSVLQKGSCPVL
jgi:hypothetical protein